MKRVLIISLVFVSILLISGINGCAQQPEIYKSSCTDKSGNSLTLANALNLAKSSSRCSQGLFETYSDVKIDSIGDTDGLDASSEGNYAICDSYVGGWWIRLNDFKKDCTRTMCFIDIGAKDATLSVNCTSAEAYKV